MGVLSPPDAPPRVMAVLNATPDSFSGDGLSADPAALVGLACQAVEDGADLLDLGAESTRPGAQPVAVDEELARIRAVLPALLERVRVPISIDTRKPRVADYALGLGASLLNDVSGLADGELAAVAARHGAYLVLTHNGWSTGERDVRPGLERLINHATKAGVPSQSLIVDPGLGFGKHPGVSLALLRDLDQLVEALAPLPVLVGASRKGFIGYVLGAAPVDRLEGSLACAAIATLHGAAVVRVHDVRPSVPAVRMAWAVRGRPRPTSATRAR
jgi:dihydropteroate synthase